MHFIKPQETTTGILTARIQELHERFLGIALRQQCSRSTYYVAVYHTHTSLLAPRTLFIGLDTDEALYKIKQPFPENTLDHHNESP